MVSVRVRIQIGIADPDPDTGEQNQCESGSTTLLKIEPGSGTSVFISSEKEESDYRSWLAGQSSEIRCAIIVIVRLEY